MAKKNNIDPQVFNLRRSVVEKFKFDKTNPHPELAKSKQKRPPYRKEKRKLAKQLKKARRIAHASHQPLENLYAEILHKKKKPEAKVKQPIDEEEQKARQIEMKQQKIEEKRIARLQEMKQFIKEDEKEIKMLSKRLKLNKRKSKTLPQAFVDAGLSYLLELCDTTKRQKVIENDVSGDEVDSFDDDQPKSDSDDDDDDEPMQSQKFAKPASSTAHSKQKQVRFAEEGENLESDEEENVTDNEMTASDDERNSSDNDDDKKLKEDIYGRLKDKKGNIIKQTLRETETVENPSSKSIGQKNMLTKLFKSLINRISEATVQSAVSKIQECFKTHSRNDVKEVLTETIFQSCIRNERIPDRLLLEQSLLLALIHSKISSEITSFFVENLAVKLKYFRLNLSENDIDDKSLDNISAMFSHLFSLKVIQSKLIFDVLKHFLATFVEKDIELILIVCQTIGNSLRKENQSEFRSILDEVQLKSTSEEVLSLPNQSRVKFMLESLQRLKMGDMLKVSNYDPTFAEHCLKLLRGTTSGKSLESPLPMSLQDLWSASTNGRWWIVGSAVIVTPLSHNSSSSSMIGVDVVSSSKMQFSDLVLKLAKKNGMNTELRRNLFCILMSSEDYLDAFEKLTKLSLKDQQEREIIHISLHCCLKEKSFNPFYSYLVQRFCSYQPRFTLTTQFALWDKFKILDELNRSEIENMALFLSHLIANKVLPLTVLKALDFGGIDENVQSFLIIFFSKFLLDTTEENLRVIFTKCMVKKKFQSFFDGVKIFLHHIFLKQVTQHKDHTQLNNRISMIDKFFYYSLDNSAL